MIERTFSIIKPDAVKRNLIGEITQVFEQGGLQVVASKMIHMGEREVEGFYAEHKGKDFFDTLVKNMTAGPCIVQVLEGENAIVRNRELMGATDPEKAETGTLRKRFAVSMQQNSVHGSDSPESAAREIAFFFSEVEIHSRQNS